MAHEFTKGGFAPGAAQLPAIYVNGFSVFMQDEVFRIGFADGGGNQEYWRLHVAMTHEAAQGLLVALQSTMREFERKKAERDAELAGAPKGLLS